MNGHAKPAYSLVRKGGIALLTASFAWIVPTVIGPVPVLAGETVKPTSIDYERDIKPLLSKRCYACHGALKRQAGLRLDTAAMMLKGGDGGPAIVPGKSEESLIVEAVAGRDGWRMPPEGEAAPFSEAEIATLRAWIDQGAKAPVHERAQNDPRKHWSFVAPVRPPVPAPSASHAGEIRSPIDSFLAVEHQRLGLTPRPQAAPGDQIRRVYLDLIGLAPTPEEVRAFVANPSDRAYEEIVDRLLASPQYGERWGRHWMDVWRYSDWDGYGAEVRESQPHIWRWRDWIVESLNQDRGYDRMIVEMLAADEAEPADSQAVRATGFLVRNWYKFNRNVWLDATVEHTAKAFLGITLNCAKCHDHKYDPIAQSEYYTFRAFFEPHTIRTDRVPGQADTNKDGVVRVYDGDLNAKTFLFTRGDEKRPATDRPLAPGVPRVLQSKAKLPSVTPVNLPPAAYYPGLSRFVQDETLAQARNEAKARGNDLAQAEKTLAAAKDPAAVAKARTAIEVARKSEEAARSAVAAIKARIAADNARFSQPPKSDAAALARAAGKSERTADWRKAEENLLRADLALADAEHNAQAAKPQDRDKLNKAVADAKAKRDQARKDLKAKRQALQAENSNYTPIGTVYPAASTGRRLALARWITDRDNPLTARIAINHLWLRHFGTSLVPTEFDFGVNGKPPTHPALLDWLAVELMESGWRMKAIHRLIVTSSAYRRQSSSGGPGDPNLAIDSANRYYWRMNPRRMEAEVVRDNVLKISGSLDPTHGGPDLDPESGLTSPRRSLYFRHAKEKRVVFLRLFDSSNVLACYRRSESVVPQQALALANSPLSFAQARLLAKSLSAKTPANLAPEHDTAFVNTAFEHVLGRGPTTQERDECVRYLAEQARRLTDRSRLTPFPSGPKASVPPSDDPAQRARESLVHVLLNHNDFVTIR